MLFHHIHDVSAQLQGAEASPMVLIVIIVTLLISRIEQGFAICVRQRWYDCIASYACTGRLFAILSMFPRCSNCAATSATSCILRFLAVTFLQPVLHAGRGYEITNRTITYHKNPNLHIPQHPLLAFKSCALLRLCAFLRLLRVFMISIRPYIGSLSRTLWTSDQTHNRFISISSCVPAAERYC